LITTLTDDVEPSEPGRFSARRWSLGLALLLGLLASCSRQGLVTQSIPPDRLPLTTPISADTLAPQFLAYGDNRPGWRVAQKFLSRSSWLTWKMALVPFYQIYWIGNGVLGSVNWLRNVPDYGGKESAMVRRAMIEYAARTRVDFVLNTGDIVTDGRYPRQWRNFFQEVSGPDGLLTRLSFLPVAGNHEDTNDPRYGEPNYDAVLGYPRFYAVHFRNASLFVLDSNILVDQDDYLEDNEQDRLFRKWIASAPGDPPAWLEQQLAASDKPFRIVAMHHPLISFGKHHRDWYKRKNGPDLLEKRDRFLAVLRRFNVQLLLAGHEHLYERSVTTFSDTSGDDDYKLYSVVTGGGGTPLRRETDEATIAEFVANFRTRGLEVRLVKHVSVYHFSSITVGTQSASIDIWEVPKDPLAELRLLDRFEIAF
jgi:3',5'-cyclic AMP phosphodiesterase CpdA